MTKAELTVVLKAEIKGLSSEFETEDYTNAINAADRDTGWSTPYSGSFKETWMLQRAKRHLFFYLQTASAVKFKYKQINLQQRFGHYSKLVDSLDKDFKIVQEEYPHEFADASSYELFGTKIDSGFSYEPETGRDTTYDSDQRVVISPNEDS